MIVVEYKLTGIEVLTRMQVINAVKRALHKLGEYWHDAFAWKRFTRQAYTEYGFRPRKLRYDRRKKSKFGEALPIVFSGEAREKLLSEGTKGRIRTTRDTVRIPMPTKLNRYNPKGPNLPDEVRRVSRAELNILQDNLVFWIEEELNREVPQHLRNQGYTGGQVRSLKLSGFRPQRSADPVQQRHAA